MKFSQLVVPYFPTSTISVYLIFLIHLRLLGKMLHIIKSQRIYTTLDSICKYVCHLFLFELCKPLFEWRDYYLGGFEYFCGAHNKNIPFLVNTHIKNFGPTRQF